MELNIDQEIQAPVSHEIIDLMLNNLLEEAETPIINKANDLFRLPAVEECIDQIPKAALVHQDEPFCNEEVSERIESIGGINVVEKMHDNIDEVLKIKKEEIEIKEDFEQNKTGHNKRFCDQDISERIESSEGIKVFEKLHDTVYKEEWKIKKEEIESTEEFEQIETGHEEPSFNQKMSERIETSEEINDFEEMHYNVDNQWKIKKEEIEIKEDLEQDETGFATAFSEIRPSAFYGKRTLPILRDIPSDSEDSELSNDEDEVEKQIAQANTEGLEFQDVDDREDDIPFSELFNLPENTKYYFFNKKEDITWKESKTLRDPESNIFLGERNLPANILELDGAYNLFKFFISDDFISQVVEQSYLYSVQKRPNKPFVTDCKEVEQFLGIIVWMSLIRQHSTRRYWAPKTRTPQIANIMPANRFEEIKQSLL